MSFAVIHGDALAELRKLPDRAVQHVISDPPYTQRTSANARTTKNISHGENITSARFIEFDGIDGQEAGLTTEFLRVASRWSIVFCAIEQIGVYSVAAGDAWVRAGVWVRTNSAPQFTGDRPGQGCEGVAIFHPKGKKRWNNGGYPARWTGPTVNGEADRAPHPTAKPLWLMLELIEAFTDPGETIVDPFCGSGTTLVAALRLGRNAIGIEKDATYAALARERCEAELSGSSLQAARAGQEALFGKAV